jgi:hypothetical protein
MIKEENDITLARGFNKSQNVLKKKKKKKEKKKKKRRLISKF